MLFFIGRGVVVGWWVMLVWRVMFVGMVWWVKRLMCFFVKDVFFRFWFCLVFFVFFRVVGIFWFVNFVLMLKDFFVREYMIEIY